MPKEKSPRPFLDKVSEYGRYPVTAAAALTVLVGSLRYARSANASANEAIPSAVGGHLDALRSTEKKQPPKTHPDGVKVLYDVTIQQRAAIQKEMSEAYSKLREVWPGVLILHTPSKNAVVQFTPSPSAYTASAQEATFFNDLSVFPGAQRFWRYEDVGIEKFNGRNYAVVIGRFGPAFLDIKWAEDNGALTMLRYKDVPEKPTHFKTIPPLPVNGSLMEGSWLKWFNKMPIKNLPDSNDKFRPVEISHTSPHP